MAYNACLQGIINAAKNIIPEDELKKLINDIKNKTKANELRKAIDDYHKTIDEFDKQQRYVYKLNAIRSRKLYNSVKGEGPTKKLVNKLIHGKESVASKQLGYSTLFQQNLLADLKPESLTTLQNGLRDVEIAKDAKFNNSQDPIIKNINQTLKNLFDDVRKRFNVAGANIGEREGWLFRQAHNVEKLKQIGANSAAEVNRVFDFFKRTGKAMTSEERFNLGFNRWSDFVKPRLDLTASKFDNYSESQLNDWLKEFYKSVLSGVHTTLSESAPYAFKGGNLLAKFNAERKLIFNGPKEEIEYAQEYGHGSLYQNVIHNISNFSKNLGILEEFGSRPEDMFERLKNKIAKENKENPDVVSSLKSRKLQAAWETATGHYKMAYDSGVAKGFSNLRGLAAVAHFAGSNITAFFMDPLGRAAGLVNNFGESWGPAVFKAYTEMFQYMKEDRAAIKNYTGAYVDHVLGGIQARLGMDSMPGKAVAKLQDATFYINGMHWLDQARTEGVAMAEGYRLAQNVTKDFSELNAATQATYRMYGINEPEFAALKNSRVTVSDKSEKKYIFADSVAKMSDEEIADYAKSTNQSTYKARNALQLKVSNFLRDSSGFIVMNAKDPTMRMIYNYFGGPGTLGGEIVRTGLLGLAWPIQFSYRAVQPLLTQGSWSNRIVNAATLTAFSFAMEYLKDNVSNWSQGKNWDSTDKLNDWRYYRDIAGKSGALGLYSSVLFNYLPNPNQAVPLCIKQAYNLTKIPYDAMNAQPGKSGQSATGELTKWAISNAPMVNLPVVKLFLDHAILYQLQEMMDPGSIEKLQYNAEKHGESYWWQPTSNLPDFAK